MRNKKLQRTSGLLGLRRQFADEGAQDAFEYLLVLGGITVAVIVTAGLPVGSSIISAVIDGVCGAVDLLSFVVTGDCTP